jgi:addiction module HigA family antidote
MKLLLDPSHPGEILKEEFMQPHGLSAIALAKRIGVPRTRIERLVKEQTGVSSDTALRLAKVFGTTAEFWINLQVNYDMAKARASVDVSAIDCVVQAAE